MLEDHQQVAEHLYSVMHAHDIPEPAKALIAQMLLIDIMLSDEMTIDDRLNLAKSMRHNANRLRELAEEQIRERN